MKIATHEAGDVVKRWNLRYFMLLVSSQPTLVYYRKVRGQFLLHFLIEREYWAVNTQPNTPEVWYYIDCECSPFKTIPCCRWAKRQQMHCP